MSDQTSNPAPVVQFTEQLPTQAGGISAIASATAPFIYFDGVPTFGFNNGIVNVTLEAVRYIPAEGKVLFDRVLVGHLRMSLQAAQSLRASLDGAIGMASAPSDPKEVN